MSSMRRRLLVPAASHSVRAGRCLLPASSVSSSSSFSSSLSSLSSPLSSSWLSFRRSPANPFKQWFVSFSSAPESTSRRKQYVYTTPEELSVVKNDTQLPLKKAKVLKKIEKRKKTYEKFQLKYGDPAVLESADKALVVSELWTLTGITDQQTLNKRKGYGSVKKHQNMLRSLPAVRNCVDTLVQFKVLKKLEPKHLNMLVLTLNKLNYRNKQKWQSVATALRLHVHTFEPKSLCVCARAFSKNGSSCQPLMEAISERAIKIMDKFTAKDLSMLAHSFAKMPAFRDKELFRVIAHHSIEQIAYFNSQDLSTLAWSYAHKKYEGLSVDKLFAAISHKTRDMLKDNPLKLGPLALVNIAWSFATLRLPDQALLMAISANACTRLESFNKVGIANLVWSCAKLGVHDEKLFEAVQKQTEPELDKLGDMILTKLAWSFSKVNYAPESYFDEIVAVSKATMDEFSDKSVVDLMYALERLKIVDEELLEAISARAEDGQSKRAIPHHHLTAPEPRQIAA